MIAHREFRVFGREAVPHLDVSVEDLPDDGLGGRGPRPVTRLRGRRHAAVDARLERAPAHAVGWRSADADAAQRERFEQARANGIRFTPKLTHTVEHGSVMQAGAARVPRLAHARSHRRSRLPARCRRRHLLAGDHVLPSITPHISGHGGVHDPLQAFYDSLDSVAQISGVRRCLPAHGHPFDDLPAGSTRSNAITTNASRSSRPSASASAKRTVRDFSQQLFQQRNWGMMAESETFAHLEHLRLRGQAECHAREDGWLVYETDSPSA